MADINIEDLNKKYQELKEKYKAIVEGLKPAWENSYLYSTDITKVKDTFDTLVDLIEDKFVCNLKFTMDAASAGNFENATERLKSLIDQVNSDCIKISDIRNEIYNASKEAWEEYTKKFEALKNICDKYIERINNDLRGYSLAIIEKNRVDSEKDLSLEEKETKKNLKQKRADRYKNDMADLLPKFENNIDKMKQIDEEAFSGPNSNF